VITKHCPRNLAYCQRKRQNSPSRDTFLQFQGDGKSSVERLNSNRVLLAENS
jgi:hypothetical protein